MFKYANFLNYAALARIRCCSYQKCHYSAVAQQAKHAVWLSTCRNIFYNLALEDWIYSHYDFSDSQSLLLLWRNQPCVVIGRHQNPWVECNIPKCREMKVDIARRRSGGGTVFHDLGNLNCTFFTHKKEYNRTLNLDLIARSLSSKFDVDVSVSERDDLVLNNKYKISGTAAKLGGKIAYHHCTLLFDVCTASLTDLLTTPMNGLKSKATESVRSQVMNLQAENPSIDYNGLIESISSNYLQSYNTEGKIQYVDPTSEQTHPGLHEMYAELKQWKWVFAKTPNFSINRTISAEDGDINYTVHVSKGHIDSIEVDSTSNNQSVPQAVLAGTPLCIHNIQQLTQSFGFQTVLQENQTLKAVIEDLLCVL